MNDKVLCDHPITNEFAEKVKEIEDAYYKAKGRGLLVTYYTMNSGFYIMYGSYKGTFAIGKKTHHEQFIFNTREEAQIQGCTEFLQYLSNKTI